MLYVVHTEWKALCLPTWSAWARKYKVRGRIEVHDVRSRVENRGRHPLFLHQTDARVLTKIRLFEGEKKKKGHIPTPLLPLSQPKHWLCWRGHGVPAFQRKLPQKKEKLIKKKESISIPLGVKDFSKGRIHVHIHKNELRPFEHPPACCKNTKLGRRGVEIIDYKICLL